MDTARSNRFCRLLAFCASIEDLFGLACAVYSSFSMASHLASGLVPSTSAALVTWRAHNPGIWGLSYFVCMHAMNFGGLLLWKSSFLGVRKTGKLKWLAHSGGMDQVASSSISSSRARSISGLLSAFREPDSTVDLCPTAMAHRAV